MAWARPITVAARTPRSPVTCFVNNGNKSAKVKFLIPKKVAFGQTVGLVGSKADLGNWDPNSSLALEWHEGHQWSAEAELPVG